LFSSLPVVQAQNGASIWQLDSDGANVTANKSKFSFVAGALEWNPAKPELSTIALSLDTTSLSDAAVKTELDARTSRNCASSPRARGASAGQDQPAHQRDHR
jgi:hypothetical protein